MMKKISNYFLMASVFVMANVPAFADDGVCNLIKGLKPVINVLRTLAFIGAAFVLMDWAWGFIKGGKAEMKDIETKGIGMLVGFFLLFAVGLILQFVGSNSGAEFFKCDITFLGGIK